MGLIEQTRRFLEGQREARATPDEQRAAAAVRHDALVRELRDTEAVLLQTVGDLDIPGAEARCRRLHEEWLAAGRSLFELTQRRTTLHQAFDRQQEELQRELIATSDPRLEVFIEECRTELDALLKKFQRYEMLGPRNLKTGHRPTFHSSNQPAIARVQQALLTAIDQARALKLGTVADVGVAIEELRRTIPTLEDAAAAIRDEEYEPLPAA